MTTAQAGTANCQRADGAGFAVNAAVKHEQWGDGTVMSLKQDRITVLFDDVGYKTLSLAAIASQQRLLTSR